MNSIKEIEALLDRVEKNGNTLSRTEYHTTIRALCLALTLADDTITMATECLRTITPLINDDNLRNKILDFINIGDQP